MRLRESKAMIGIRGGGPPLGLFFFNAAIGLDGIINPPGPPPAFPDGFGGDKSSVGSLGGSTFFNFRAASCSARLPPPDELEFPPDELGAGCATMISLSISLSKA